MHFLGELQKKIIFTFLIILFSFAQALAQNERELESIVAFYKAFEREGVGKKEYKDIHQEVFPRLRFIQVEDSLVKDYEGLRQIALIRHGKPKVSKVGKFNRRLAQQYIELYDQVEVFHFNKKPFYVYPGEIDTVYSSTLRRAEHTAELIFAPEVPIQSQKKFIEFQRKLTKLPGFRAKRSIKSWLGVSRVLWLLGMNDKGIESFRQARKRAKEGASYLAQKTERKQKVVLVAHGFLNSYVRKYLKKQGWHLVREAGREYLGVSILVKTP